VIAVDIRIDIDGPGRITGHLREGSVETTVTSANSSAAAAALVSALEQAKAEGDSQCFWHEPTGQYWWMFRREGALLEVVVLWSSGTVTGWQHVFRAADEVDHLIERVREELAKREID
jgi:hypothetical protein